MSPRDTVRIAAIGDLHCTKNSQSLQSVFARAHDVADVLVLAGDLTDYGTPEEAHVLVRDLAAAKMPVVGVLGNHDFESGKPDEVAKILAEGGVRVLDGDSCEFHGVGFAGVKGFCGGFGTHALGPWGEPMIKQFVREAVNEALKLETALARLRTPHRIAILHYAPIPETVEGEPIEVYPFLGSSRLEEPLGRYPVSAVVHGHAHRGRLEAKTRSGVPVYNVARPLLERSFPDRPPFRVLEVPRNGGGENGSTCAPGTPRPFEALNRG
jgi:Icc-related predicted phosphoesterase